MRLASAALLGLLTASATAAHAQNLVTNPGFEAGTAGWTFTGRFTGVATDPGGAHSGERYAQFGAVTGTGSATQTVATTPGAAYTFSFYLANTNGVGEGEGAIANSFVAKFGGRTLLDLTNAGDFAYQLFSFDIVATGGSADVEFTGRNVPDFYRLDDVSLTPRNVVPEPSTWALLGTGLASLAGTAARRRRSGRPTA